MHRLPLTIALTSALLWGAPSPTAEQQALRSLVALHTPLQPGETVANVESVGSDSLRAQLLSSDGSQRVVTFSIGGRAPQAPPGLSSLSSPEPAPLPAALEGSPVARPLGPARPAPLDTSSVGIQTTPTLNKVSYLGFQTLYTASLYGVVLPELLNSNGRTSEAVALLAFPASFGVHFYLISGQPINDATSSATTITPVATWLASLAIGHLFRPDISLRAIAWIALISYPTGLYGGYKLGRLYRNDPARINQFTLGAATGAFTGMFFSASLLSLFHHQNPQVILSGVLVGAAGGICSTVKWPSDRLSSGAALGTFNRMALTLGTAFYGAYLYREHIGSIHPAASYALIGAGVAASYAEGLLFESHHKDSYERSFYTLLGTGTAAAFGAGLATLLNTTEPTPFFGMLLASSYGGYLLTRHLTRHLQDDGYGTISPDPKGWNLSFVPTPELALTGASNQPYLRASFLRLSKGF